MKTIYWAPPVNTDWVKKLDMLWFEPTCVIDTLKSIYSRLTPKDSSMNFLACPSVVKEAKKTFVIKSPVDLTFQWDGDNVVIKEYNQEFFDQVFDIRDINGGMFAFNFRMFFFSEESLVVKVIPAYLNTCEFSRSVTMFSGSVDISKWFRPYDTAFIVNTKEPVHIKRGDPLYYIIIDTDDDVEFKRFIPTQEITDISNNCLSIKRFLPHKKLDFLYDLFTSNNYNKRLAKTIKQNLVE